VDRVLDSPRRQQDLARDERRPQVSLAVPVDDFRLRFNKLTPLF
jgi:hypothetical protein